MGGFCGFKHKGSRPIRRTVVPMVVCCVASRNKRAHRAFYCQPLPESYPQQDGSTLLLFDLGGPGAREERQLSTRERRVAGLRGGRRPARAALRAARAPPHHGKFAASGECNELRRVAVRRVGWRRTARLCESQKQQPIHRPRLPGSALAPPGTRLWRPRSQFKRSKTAGFGVEAGSKRRYASLRCGRLRPARPFGSQEHSMFLSGSGCALRGWAEGPARRENRNRFSRPKNEHAPGLRPVSASLRLRCRSAAFSRALGKSCQNAPAHFDDFPL